MASVDYPKTDESELSDTSMYGSSESVEYTVVVGKSSKKRAKNSVVHL